MSTLAATNLKNASSGSNNIVLNADGTTTIASPSNIIKSGTAVASTSGTSIDFTSIPSWVKRVTVMFNGVSTSAANFKLVQIGSGTVSTSGYVSQAGALANAAGSGATQRTDGFHIYSNSSAHVVYGSMVLTLQTGNTWVSSHSGGYSSTVSGVGGGSLALSGALDRVRITSVGSTDTFTAGSINILWEG
jgi:hypothetical protein